MRSLKQGFSRTKLQITNQPGSFCMHAYVPEYVLMYSYLDVCSVPPLGTSYLVVVGNRRLVKQTGPLKLPILGTWASGRLFSSLAS